MQERDSRSSILHVTSIYRGILTGYNDAFVVDTELRNRLIAEDPRSDEVLKPVLRGRDISRYRANWAGLWLIDTHNGYADVPPINVDDYPAIKAYLNRFIGHLRRRQDKGVTPYNLRNCAYHAQFSQEKLFWMDLTTKGRFSYSPASSEILCVNTVYFMHGSNIKQLAAFLNSSLITWYVNVTASTSGMGTARWFAYVVEAIPIPTSLNEICHLENLVDDLLTNDLDENGKLYQEIERIVYQSYGITQIEEAKIRENVNRLVIQ